MSPKEKAKELVNKILESLYDNGSLSFKRILYSKAEQCALIAVDEILEAQPSRRYWDTYDDETPSAVTYWQEVKNEIEKL